MHPIELSDLCLSFGAFRALDGVSLSVAAGEKVVLLGPSGSGKSSLLRCINGLAEPEAGTVRLFGEAVRDGAALRRARQRLGTIFQQFNLYSTRTALENVALAPRRLRGLDRAAAEALALRHLEAVGVAPLAAKYPFQLSGGEQQRVAIARALAMEPEVLLLDEPTSALDPELVQSVLALIERLCAAGGRTVLCVTHELGFARRLADRVVFMDAGRIVEEGPPGELFTRPRSERLRRFLEQVRREAPASGAAPGGAPPRSPA